MGVGFLFAVLVLTISVISFPMLLDRDAGLHRGGDVDPAVVANPVPMAVWGLIVAGGLLLGSLPALLGLIVVMPVLAMPPGTCIASWCRADPQSGRCGAG